MTKSSRVSSNALIDDDIEISYSYSIKNTKYLASITFVIIYQAFAEKNFGGVFSIYMKAFVDWESTMKTVTVLSLKFCTIYSNMFLLYFHQVTHIYCSYDLNLWHCYSLSLPFYYARLLLLHNGAVVDPIFGEFEMKLAGHVIDSDTLTLKEPIGEGKVCWCGFKSTSLNLQKAANLFIVYNLCCSVTNSIKN